MLKRLLSTIVTLAFVVCGAMIALEALGLLFQAGTADPGRRAEAFHAEIEVNLDQFGTPPEIETEPVWQGADRGETAQPVRSAEPIIAGTADRPAQAGHEARQPAAADTGEVVPPPAVDDPVQRAPDAEAIVAASRAAEHDAAAPVAAEAEDALPAALDVAARPGAAAKPLPPTPPEPAPAAAQLAAASMPAATDRVPAAAARPPAAPRSARRGARRAANNPACPLFWWLE